MNPLIMVMAVVTSFCAPRPGQPAECIHERMLCIQAGAGSQKDDVSLIEECLTDPKAHVKAEKSVAK